MQLKPKDPAPIKQFTDVDGKRVSLTEYDYTLVAFFRDARCPFCHFRIFELNKHFDALSKKGMNVVVIFSASESEVNTFLKKRPLPFPIVADADNSLHTAYGVVERELGFFNKMAMMLTNFGKMLKGVKLVGNTNAKQSNSLILPADFIVNQSGVIDDVFYSKDYAERMPMQRIFRSLAR